MRRKATKILSSSDGRREIYVDDINSGAILAYLGSSKRHREKFRFIADIILNGYQNKCFVKEDINNKCKDVFAMRFFVGQENDRIYCKKISKANKVIVVVACELHLGKKSKKLSSKEKNKINSVASYEYDIR